MFDKKILIDAKWHRVAFPLALNITKKQLEQNLELFISVFKEISKDWLRLKNKNMITIFFLMKSLKENKIFKLDKNGLSLAFL